MASSTLALLLAGCATADHGKSAVPVKKITRDAVGADPDLAVCFAGADVVAWRRQRAEVCLGVDEAPTSVAEGLLADLRDPIMSTGLGQRLAQDLQRFETTLCTNDAMPIEGRGYGGFYKKNYRAMTANEAVPTGQQILHAAHEWRHAWHDAEGFMTPTIEHNRPHHTAKVFMLEADARAFATAIAWQLREKGDSRAWDAAIAIKTYQPITKAFEQKMTDLAAMGDPNITNSDSAIRSAMGSAYRAWFADKDMATPYAQQVFDQAAGYAVGGQAWPGREALSYQSVVGIGRLPGQGVDRASYIQPADAQLAVDDAYRRTSTREAPLPIQGLPNPTAARKSAPTPG